MAYFDRKCALSEFFQTLSSNVSEDLRPSHIDFQLQLDRIQERDSFHIFSLIDIFKDMQIKISE